MEKIGQGHPLSQSPDFVKENIELLKSLFPTIVKEGKIVMEELEALLGEEVEKEEEYYNFTWAGKSMARREANKPSTATLRPIKPESKEWDTTGNIFIEGDNLEVLKLLRKSYQNKIKMIYIDPPYNTGKDFVYKDNYADNLSNYLSLSGQTDEEGIKTSTNVESDGRYHSNWLNLMYPRLKIAKELLKDDGAIFISIDDNEITNLQKLTEEIFGGDNFVSTLIWKSGRTAASHFTNEHEYVLVYCKSKKHFPLFEFNGEEIISDRTIKKPSDKNPLSKIKFPAGIDFESEDRIFPKSFGKNEPINVTQGVLECYQKKLKNDVEIEAAWSMKDMIISWLEGEDVYDQKGQKVSRFFFKENGVLQYEKEKGTIHPKTIIDGFTTKNGTNDILNLFGVNYFEFPKPKDLISSFVNLFVKDDEIVMDFFAGSGTTAHSVFDLNATDGKGRKFICVQLPEKTTEKDLAYKDGYKTISEITCERIRRAGERVLSSRNGKLKKLKEKSTLIQTEEDKNETKRLEDIVSKLDIGFRYFKLDVSNIKTWDSRPQKLEETLFSAGKNIKDGRSEEDVLFEILLKYGLDLTVPIEEKKVQEKSVYSVGYGTLFICLADGITTEVAEVIGSWKEELNPPTARVIFKDSGFTDVQKTNSIQILKRFGISEVNTI